MKLAPLVAVVLVVACGGKIEGEPTDRTDSPAPSSTSTSAPPGRSSSSSSGNPPGPEPSDGCPADTPLSVSDLDAQVGWKSATASPGACSDADITQLVANFKDTALASYFDLGKKLSFSCKACVVSKDTDSSWGPIVGTAADQGQTGFINYGACFGVVAGAECGKAVEYETFCTNLACSECATTSSTLQKCTLAALSDTGMCSSFDVTKSNVCPNYASAAKSCTNLIDAVKTVCGP